LKTWGCCHELAYALRNRASSSLQCLANGYSTTGCASSCCGGLDNTLGCCSGFGDANTGKQVLQCIGWQRVGSAKHTID
jgi:hypothetical protein